MIKHTPFYFHRYVSELGGYDSNVIVTTGLIGSINEIIADTVRLSLQDDAKDLFISYHGI
tara:strand:+ start:515 stop:694 length:180 start_codon:yes stop_codon:yes gene_type:complete